MEAVYHPASNKQTKLPPTMSLLRAKLLLMIIFSDMCARKHDSLVSVRRNTIHGCDTEAVFFLKSLLVTLLNIHFVLRILVASLGTRLANCTQSGYSKDKRSLSYNTSYCIAYDIEP